RAEASSQHVVAPTAASQALTVTPIEAAPVAQPPPPVVPPAASITTSPPVAAAQPAMAPPQPTAAQQPTIPQPAVTCPPAAAPVPTVAPQPSVAAAEPPAPAKHAPHRTKPVAKVVKKAPAHHADDDAPAATGASGKLAVSAKPPCQIVIDGKSTGLTTPQRA